jgi:hypothetical protein
MSARVQLQKYKELVMSLKRNATKANRLAASHQLDSSSNGLGARHSSTIDDVNTKTEESPC